MTHAAFVYPIPVLNVTMVCHELATYFPLLCRPGAAFGVSGDRDWNTGEMMVGMPDA